MLSILCVSLFEDLILWIEWRQRNTICIWFGLSCGYSSTRHGLENLLFLTALYTHIFRILDEDLSMRSYPHREHDRKLMLISKEIRESRTSRNFERYDWNMFLSRLLTVNSWCEISDSTLNTGNDIHLISPKHHNWMIRSSGRGQTEIEFVWIYWIGKWHRFFFIMHEIHEYATHVSKKKHFASRQITSIFNVDGIPTI